MPATLIDGKKISQEIKGEIRRSTENLRRERGIVPGLAFILVGENPSSQSYVKMKGKGCEEVGFHSVTERLPAGTTEADLLRLVNKFNQDPSIHGVLVQLPLPQQIDEGRVIAAIDYRKDVDGFHPINVGRLVIGQPSFTPCTPAGIQELLLRSGVDPSGKHVVVLGRSNIVGKPISNLLLQKKEGANAIVTVVHTGARDIARYSRLGDILIAAMGRPEYLTGEMIKPGAVVIDVGINRREDPSTPSGYRIVGDVHFESAREVAGAITPVPGGVGPMTIAMVLRNTLLAAEGALYPPA